MIRHLDAVKAVEALAKLVEGAREPTACCGAPCRRRDEDGELKDEG